jgi:hypothetical protein
MEIATHGVKSPTRCGVNCADNMARSPSTRFRCNAGLGVGDIPSGVRGVALLPPLRNIYRVGFSRDFRMQRISAKANHTERIHSERCTLSFLYTNSTFVDQFLHLYQFHLCATSKQQ